MNQNSPDIALRALFDAQHRASRQHMAVPLALRRDRLLRVRRLLDEHGPAMAAAVEADFGVRSPQLTDIADELLLRSLLAHTLKSLPRWLKPEKVATPLHLLPSRAYLQRQPLGVVGVVAPWNYPLQLSLAPAITALAAGNRVMLKPSELTPLTSALLGELVPKYFAEDEFCVVQGDAALASAFVSLPFDHLVFTGSTQTGRKVAQAAAANLTPYHVGAGRQVALHSGCLCGPGGGRHQNRPRQVTQCRANLYCARLHAGSARHGGCFCRRFFTRRTPTFSGGARESGLRIHHQCASA